MDNLYLCTNCKTIYNNSQLNDKNADYSVYYKKCPNAQCEHTLIQIDEIMIPTIMMLNEKGYETKFCCSGHFYRDVIDCYIKFTEEVINIISKSIEYNLIDPLPEEFYVYVNCIRNKREYWAKTKYVDISSNEAADRIKYVTKLNNKLYRWCCDLCEIEICKKMLDEQREEYKKSL